MNGPGGGIPSIEPAAILVMAGCTPDRATGPHGGCCCGSCDGVREISLERPTPRSLGTASADRPTLAGEGAY